MSFIEKKYQNFLLFSQCLQKSFSSEVAKPLCGKIWNLCTDYDTSREVFTKSINVPC